MLKRIQVHSFQGYPWYKSICPSSSDGISMVYLWHRYTQFLYQSSPGISLANPGISYHIPIPNLFLQQINGMSQKQHVSGE